MTDPDAEGRALPNPENGHWLDHAAARNSLSSNEASPTPQLSSSDHDVEKLDTKFRPIESVEPASSVLEEPQDTSIVTWDSPSDPVNPMNWPALYRWTLISLVSAVTFTAGLSSSMFAPSVEALMTEFHSTNSALGSFVVTVFVLGLATGPLLFAPLSEIYGRFMVQHVGCIGFFAFTIACAVSNSLNMLIGMRFLQGTFAAVQLTNGGGIIADMIKQEKRGFATSMLTLGTLLGPVVGPVAGAFLGAAKGWRWVFWILSMLLGILTLLNLFLWRETYAPVILQKKTIRLRLETGNPNLRSKYDQGLSPRDHFRRGIIRPLKMLIFSPIVLALSIHMGLAYAYFYLLFTTLTPVFITTYHFSHSIVGLSFLGVGTGFLVGQLIFARLGDGVLMWMARRGDGELKPEYRLPLCCLGGVFIPVGFLVYGWTVEKGVFWIVPILGTGVAGLANSLVFIGIQAYVIDAFTLYAASGLAALTATRSVMAAVLPLAAPKMYQALGYGWGNSLLAFLALAMVPVPCFLFWYGEKMRRWNGERLRTL